MKTHQKSEPLVGLETLQSPMTGLLLISLFHDSGPRLQTKFIATVTFSSAAVSVRLYFSVLLMFYCA